MTRNVRVIYLYVVSLITLGMVVGSFIGIVTNTTSYFKPVVNAYWYYDRMVTEDNLAVDNSDINSIKKYEQYLEIEKENAKRESLKNVFSSISLFVISLPLYLFHFKQSKKLEEMEEK